jgi:chorismate--pyruvate lyase
MPIWFKNKRPNLETHRRLPAHFHKAAFLCKAKMSPEFSDVFLDPASMTAILNKLSNNNLTLTLLQHQWQQPQASEQNNLQLKNQWGIGREVLLNSSGESWIYARSFFPEAVVRAHGGQFSALGTQPLGEILFSNPQCHRGGFSFAFLQPGHGEFQAAAAHFQDNPGHLWARYSQFYLPSGAISLLEVFSPAMEKALAQQSTQTLSVHQSFPHRRANYPQPEPQGDRHKINELEKI